MMPVFSLLDFFFIYVCLPLNVDNFERVGWINFVFNQTLCDGFVRQFIIYVLLTRYDPCIQEANDLSLITTVPFLLSAYRV